MSSIRDLPTNDLIREILGENHSIPLGWQVLIQTYNFGDNFLNEDGTPTIFERPDIAKDRDRTQVGVGKVLMIGSAAFKGNKFEYWDIIPTVGDYVSFKKYSGDPRKNGSVHIQNIDDTDILNIEPDPSKCGNYQFY